MPIPGDEFEKGSSGAKNLSEVMNADLGYTTSEVSELVGRSWGIAKSMLVAAQKEGHVDMKKIGRKHYWKYYPGGVPDFDPSAFVDEEEPEEDEE